MLSKPLRLTFIPRLTSIGAQIFLATVALHIAAQLALNVVLPFPYYSELNNHDGQVYYAIATNPVPEHPEFTLKRYQRPLLPLLVWAFFGWDRRLGFSVINTIAASIAALYFYNIVKERQESAALRLTLLCTMVPFLFASAHMGLAEPLLIAGLLAGYYYGRRGETGKAACGYALALLAKEIALFPLLAEIVLALRRGDRRAALCFGASLAPMACWYLLLGIHWDNLFWMLHGSEGQLGFGPAAMLDLIVHPPMVVSVPPIFFILNQIANGLLLALIFAGLYQLRGDRSVVTWVAFSVAPLLFLSREVYAYNFDFGRQALPAVLLLVALRRSRLVFDGRFYWTAVGALLCCALFWVLYYAKFFVYY